LGKKHTGGYLMFGPLFEPGLKFYLEAIKSGNPFSFVRYGDGDLLIACPTLKYRHFQRERFDFHRALTKRMMAKTMTRVHKKPRYWPAIQMQHIFEFKRYPWQFRRLRRWVRSEVPRKVWHDASVWRQASETGKIDRLANAIERCPLSKVVMGPPYHKALAKKLGAIFIPLKRRGAWQQRGKMADAIRKHSPALFSICAGPAAKVVIHALWNEVGQESYMIDFGAVWDPYCGVRSRGYHWGLGKCTLS